jgi:aldose 1-epimerase
MSDVMISKVQTHRLEAGNHSVELCNVGASITAIIFHGIDIVLGYASGETLYESENPMYLGTVVGRVANRIAHGTFHLHSADDTSFYKLECNHGPHHLHGGTFGFHRQVWDVERLSDSAILFSYLSKDGDEGYPGTVLVKALYSVTLSEINSLIISLTLSAQLLPCRDGTMKPSPINLSQHSYFNLEGHDSAQGILNHTLWMPQAKAFLPVDDYCIPTKNMVFLDAPEARHLDFRQGKSLIDVLTAMAQDKGMEDLWISGLQSNRDFPPNWTPFGIDVSFVLDSKTFHQGEEGFDGSPKQDNLHMAAVLMHPQSKRRLTVYTDAPAVQVYTGHYLSRTAQESRYGRKAGETGSFYPPFSGICLETQHFPDSISLSETLGEDENKLEWERGQCPILLPGIRENYSQHVEYHLDLV